jgi:O-acetyl-ADP-ribose deacetylase (regulator of RNase III)
MIEFVKGNFFDFQADARVNTVNCVGVMGAGAALQFKNRFPKMFEEYVQACKLGKIQIGKPQVWIDQEFFNHSPIIINFPTKDHWKKPSEYRYIELGLVWLRGYLLENHISVLTLPALGCGHGGLDWDLVKPMIEVALQGLTTRILVFEPESSTTVGHFPDLEKELADKGIGMMVPGDRSFPTKLIGKAATELYYYGNQKLVEAANMLSVLIGNKPSEKEKESVSKVIEAIGLYEGQVCLMSYNTSFEIDQIKILLQKKLKVILVIPYGILNLKLRKDIRALWSPEDMLVLSSSKPKQSWNPSENLKNLRLKLLLSKAIMFTSEQIDYFSKIEKEFLYSDAHFFYLNYWSEQPKFFLRLGAHKIGRDKNTLLPNLLPIKNTLYRQ